MSKLQELREYLQDQQAVGSIKVHPERSTVDFDVTASLGYVHEVEFVVVPADGVDVDAELTALVSELRLYHPDSVDNCNCGIDDLLGVICFTEQVGHIESELSRAISLSDDDVALRSHLVENAQKLIVPAEKRMSPLMRRIKVTVYTKAKYFMSCR